MAAFSTSFPLPQNLACTTVATTLIPTSRQLVEGKEVLDWPDTLRMLSADKFCEFENPQARLLLHACMER